MTTRFNKTTTSTSVLLLLLLFATALLSCCNAQETDNVFSNQQEKATGTRRLKQKHRGSNLRTPHASGSRNFQQGQSQSPQQRRRLSKSGKGKSSVDPGLFIVDTTVFFGGDSTSSTAPDTTVYQFEVLNGEVVSFTPADIFLSSDTSASYASICSELICDGQLKALVEGQRIEDEDDDDDECDILELALVSLVDPSQYRVSCPRPRQVITSTLGSCTTTTGATCATDATTTVTQLGPWYVEFSLPAASISQVEVKCCDP